MILDQQLIGNKFLELISGYGHFRFLWAVENLQEMEFIGKLIKETKEILKQAQVQTKEHQCRLRSLPTAIKLLLRIILDQVSLIFINFKQVINKTSSVETKIFMETHQALKILLQCSSDNSNSRFMIKTNKHFLLITINFINNNHRTINSNFKTNHRTIQIIE